MSRGKFDRGNTKTKQVLELLRRGETAQTAALIVDAPAAWVYQVARKHSVKFQTRGEQVRDLVKEGLTAPLIAAKLGMSTHGVYWVASREKIKLPPMPKGPKNRRGWTTVGWMPDGPVSEIFDCAKLVSVPVDGPVIVNTDRPGDAAEVERFMRDKGVKKCPSAAVGPTQAELHKLSPYQPSPATAQRRNRTMGRAGARSMSKAGKAVGPNGSASFSD